MKVSYTEDYVTLREKSGSTVGARYRMGYMEALDLYHKLHHVLSQRGMLDQVSDEEFEKYRRKILK